MLSKLALLVVLAAGCYLVGLGVLALVAPQKAKGFLLAFAGSASAHYLELATRLAVG